MTGPARAGSAAGPDAACCPTSPGVSVLGDSISTLAGWVPDGWRVHYGGEARVEGVERPSDTWWGKVIERLGGRLVANSSYSGSVVEGFGVPAGDSHGRVAALRGPDGEVPDAVLVYMGINDYGWAGGRNQVMGGSPSVSASPEELGGPHEVLPVADEGARGRFVGAYRSMLGKVRALAPEAAVWCLTLAPGTVPGKPGACYKYSIRGVGLDDYNRAIRDAARAEGARVADVRAFGVDYDAVDGAHPSALGMAQIAEMVALQMAGLPADPALSPLLASAQRSARRCFEPCCAGCAYADGDPRRWTIFCGRGDPVCGEAAV